MELLARGEAAGHGKRVATTWALAFDQIDQAAPGAAGLLRLLACCAPDAVPVGLLLQRGPEVAESLGPAEGPLLSPLLADPLAVDDAVVVLRRYSLISVPQGGAVSVHRLVQFVTLAQLPAEEAGAWRQAAAALIAAALPASPELPESWPVFAALMPHALAALTPGSAGIGQIGSYLGYSGSYAAARDLYRQILDAREHVLGPEHPETLAARASLADWTGEAGDAAGARDLVAALLAVQERVLGTEHPCTLTSRHKLAGWTWEAGDAAGAKDMFAALLPVAERVRGPEHPYTLAARASLARWTGEAGDAAGARDQFAALLPVEDRALGPEHPETLITRASLADWTGEAGDAAGARDQFAALLPVQERVLGPEHPHTLAARHGLVRWAKTSS